MGIDPLEIDFDDALNGAEQWKIRIFREASSLLEGQTHSRPNDQHTTDVLDGGWLAANGPEL
jgi:hypothetical protein